MDTELKKIDPRQQQTHATDENVANDADVSNSSNIIVVKTAAKAPTSNAPRTTPSSLKKTLFGHFFTHALDVHIPNILIGVSASVELPLIMILGRLIGAPQSEIAQYVTVSSLCRTSLDIPFGVLVEFVGVKQVMLLSLVMNAIASYIGFSVYNSVELIIFCALSGISLGGFFLSRHIFVGTITKRKQRGVMMSVVSGLLRWSHVIGPAATGLITTYTGSVRYAFFISFATSLVAFVSIVLDGFLCKDRQIPATGGGEGGSGKGKGHDHHQSLHHRSHHDYHHGHSHHSHHGHSHHHHKQAVAIQSIGENKSNDEQHNPSSPSDVSKEVEGGGKAACKRCARKNLKIIVPTSLVVDNAATAAAANLHPIISSGKRNGNEGNHSTASAAAVITAANGKDNSNSNTESGESSSTFQHSAQSYAVAYPLSPPHPHPHNTHHSSHHDGSEIEVNKTTTDDGDDGNNQQRSTAATADVKYYRKCRSCRRKEEKERRREARKQNAESQGRDSVSGTRTRRVHDSDVDDDHHASSSSNDEDGDDGSDDSYSTDEEVNFDVDLDDDEEEEEEEDGNHHSQAATKRRRGCRPSHSHHNDDSANIASEIMSRSAVDIIVSPLVLVRGGGGKKTRNNSRSGSVFNNNNSMTSSTSRRNASFGAADSSSKASASPTKITMSGEGMDFSCSPPSVVTTALPPSPRPESTFTTTSTATNPAHVRNRARLVAAGAAAAAGLARTTNSGSYPHPHHYNNGATAGNATQIKANFFRRYTRGHAVMVQPMGVRMMRYWSRGGGGGNSGVNDQSMNQSTRSTTTTKCAAATSEHDKLLGDKETTALSTTASSVTVGGGGEGRGGPNNKGENERGSGLSLLWWTIRAYWPIIWRLGVYVISFGALRSNRKLMVTMAGMRANMKDAEVAYLLSMGFVFDAFFFPLGGIVLDVFGRRVATVCAINALGIIFLLLPFAAAADASQFVMGLEIFFSHVRSLFGFFSSSAASSSSSSGSALPEWLPTSLVDPSPHVFLYMVSAFFGLADSIGCGLIMTLVADHAPTLFPAPYYGVMRTLADMGHVVGAGGVSLLLKYVPNFYHCCFVLVAQGFFTGLWGYYMLAHYDEDEEDEEEAMELLHEDSPQHSADEQRRVQQEGSEGKGNGYGAC